MSKRRPRYSKEEFLERGTALYEEQILPTLDENNEGMVVAIDIDTGEFELGDDTLSALKRLLNRCPDAHTWFVRIGHPVVSRLGPRKPLSK